MCKMRKRTMKIKTVAIALLLAMVFPYAAYAAEPAAAAVPQPVDPVDVFLAQSAFVGNSVGEGLTMYNNAKKKVPLGNATMLTRVSYSFYADERSMSKYLPVFGGKAMRAKDAIKACGAAYVFISMGTNDLVGNSTPEKAYASYQKYLTEIMLENPFVTIFVESCTPTRPGSNVNNAKVAAFNNYMRAYCDMFPNMFYVDIATPLMDSTGYLNAALSSDGSVHLTNKAYEIWANTIRAYIANFLAARFAALQAQHEIEHAKAQANYEEAMRKMDEKKQELFRERMIAKEKAKEEEKARALDELLNVPDDITIMQKMIASKEKPKYSIVGMTSPDIVSFK